ncbi:unnamed protein product, partial [Brachionus calyciflorus]
HKKELGQQCLNDTFCNSFLGLKCIDSICSCDDDHIKEENNCIMKIPSNYTDCKESEKCTETRLICNDNTGCVCPNKTLWFKTKCENIFNLKLIIKSNLYLAFRLLIKFNANNNKIDNPILHNGNVLNGIKVYNFKLPIDIGKVEIKISIFILNDEYHVDFDSSDLDRCFVFRKLDNQISKRSTNKNKPKNFFKPVFKIEQCAPDEFEIQEDQKKSFNFSLEDQTEQDNLKDELDDE